MCISTAPATAWGAELVWIGGTDNSWQTPTNWSPIFLPGEDPIQRVPQDGDTVLISDTTHGAFVQLDGDSARLAGLTVENGFELSTNDHFLFVEDGGGGVTTVRGEGTRLVLQSRGRNAEAFQSDLLNVLEGGTFFLVDSGEHRNLVTAHVLGATIIDSDSEFGGRGKARFGTEATLDGEVVLLNEGTIRPVSGRRPLGQPISLSIEAAGAGMVDLSGERSTGRIVADGPGTVVFANDAIANSIPFSGTVVIGADDHVVRVDPLDSATIFFNGQNDAPAAWFGQGHASGATIFHINQGEAIIEGPGFQMSDGSIRVHADANLLVGSADYRLNELAGSSFILEDGSTFRLGGYEPLSLTFSEFDLDGETGATMLLLEVLSSLTINATSLDNDALSPAFDGTIVMQGSDLTVNVPGGWELDGRLSVYEGSTLNGTTIVVDGGEPEDGIYFGGFDYITQVNADLVLTQNAHVEVGGPVLLNGSITHLLRSDYNDNGQVEQGDLDLVLLNWGRDASTLPDGWTSDLPSGLIDQDELDKLLLYWGDDMSLFAGLPAEQGRAGQAGAVPEPRTAALAIVLALTLVWKQHRKR